MCVHTETPQSLADKHYVQPTPLTPGMFGYSLLRPARNREYFNSIMDNCARFAIPIEGLHTETGPNPPPPGGGGGGRQKGGARSHPHPHSPSPPPAPPQQGGCGGACKMCVTRASRLVTHVITDRAVCSLISEV
jgi:hypothetical protein